METNKPVTIPVETVGQAYLELLRARGHQVFFRQQRHRLWPDHRRAGKVWRREKDAADADHGSA